MKRWIKRRSKEKSTKLGAIILVCFGLSFFIPQESQEFFIKLLTMIGGILGVVVNEIEK